MVRHIYGQPARGNGRHRLGLTRETGKHLPDKNYGGVQNLEDQVVVIYHSDLDMLLDNVVDRYQGPLVACLLLFHTVFFLQLRPGKIQLWNKISQVSVHG